MNSIASFHDSALPCFVSEFSILRLALSSRLSIVACLPALSNIEVCCHFRTFKAVRQRNVNGPDRNTDGTNYFENSLSYYGVLGLLTSS